MAAVMAIKFEVDAERAPGVIQAAREKYNYHPADVTEVVERPPIPYVPMTEERKRELLEALERRLPRTVDEDAIG